jgi:hypothetical protein
MIKLTNPGILKYPYVPAKGSKSNSMENAISSFEPSGYEFNGSVTASVKVNGVLAGAQEDTLYAFVNNEVRGVISGQYFSPKDVYLFPIMIHSNQSEGENVEFRYYSAEKDKVYHCNTTIQFKTDMIISDAVNPFILNVVTGLASSIIPEKSEDLILKSYPNPFDHYLNIEYVLSELSWVRLTIYDALGRKVKILVDNEQRPDNYLFRWNSSESSEGMYIIKLQTNSLQKTQTVILIK